MYIMRLLLLATTSCRTLGESFSGREKSKSFVHHESILLHVQGCTTTKTKTMGIVCTGLVTHSVDLQLYIEFLFPEKLSGC